MNKEKIKNISMIIAIIVIIILILGIIIYKILNNRNDQFIDENEPGVTYPTEEEINSFSHRLQALVDSINYLSPLLNSDKFSNDDVYINTTTGQTCQKYIGENADLFSSVIDTIYDNPFSRDKIFNMEEKENGDWSLYVCKPSCNVKQLTKDDITIIEDISDSEKKLKIENKEYLLKKTYEMWKFSEPVILCENVN